MIFGRLAFGNGISNCENDTGSDSMDRNCTLRSGSGVVASCVGVDIWVSISTGDAASASAAATKRGEGIGGIGVDGTSEMTNSRSFGGVRFSAIS